MRATHYRGRIDGDIKEYLIEMHSNGAVAPSFRGHEPFKQMWEMGIITPEIASIRLVHGSGMDEHYMIINENTMEGISLMAHSGKPGFHNIQDILSKTEAPFWEISGLHPRAFRE